MEAWRRGGASTRGRGLRVLRMCVCCVSPGVGGGWRGWSGWSVVGRRVLNPEQSLDGAFHMSVGTPACTTESELGGASSPLGGPRRCRRHEQGGGPDAAD